MLLDGTNFDGGGHSSPWCRACKQPIFKDQASTHIAFDQDPHGFKGLTGQYHMACSKPFASIAHALDMLSRPRF